MLGTACALAPTRSVARIERGPRLPVWPVVNGLVACALDVVGLEKAASFVEQNFGGRVCPMMLGEDADPFVLLVHHRHAFDAWDPVRPLFRLLLPEGFPAHPHVGFETVTATIQGGLKHRDSVGVKEEYADGEVQWLTAGKGVLHEEMWHYPRSRDCELYQLWVNLPNRAKKASPRTVIVQPVEDTKEGVVEAHLGGNYMTAGEEAETGPERRDVRLSRLKLLDKGASHSLNLPQQATALVYVRRGAVELGGERIDCGRLAYTNKDSAVLTVSNPDDDAAEVLLLLADPIGEPVVASGTWVVSSQRDLAQADADYRRGSFGVPWDHELDDAQWQAWVRDHRSAG